MKTSKRFELNTKDLQQWGMNALVFAGPALLVLGASVGQAIPSNWKYGAAALYCLNVATDLLRKFVATNTKKK